MQKWEYCRLSGFVGDERHVNPKITFFTVEGEKEENLAGGHEVERVARRIAQLGLEGWEMVSVVPVESYVYRTIFFKRSIAN